MTNGANITENRDNIFSITVYLHGNKRSIGEIEKYLMDTYPEYSNWEIFRFNVTAGLPKGDYGQTLDIGFMKRPGVNDQEKDSRKFVVGC